MIKKLFWMWVCVTASEFIVLAVNISNYGFDWHVYVSCGGLLICIWGLNRWNEMRKAEQERIAVTAAMIEEFDQFSKETLKRIESGELIIPPDGLEFGFKGNQISISMSNPESKTHSDLSTPDKP